MRSLFALVESRPSYACLLRPLLGTLLAVAGVTGCSLRLPYVAPGFTAAAPLADTVVQRLILIGDAGEPKEPEPVLDGARTWAEDHRGRTAVVYLGDNVYPRGLIESDRENAERRLVRQIDAFAGLDATVVFVPGNHDWNDGDPGGLEAIERQAAFVVQRQARFMPQAGCPGPQFLDLPAGAPVVRLVAIDTQWWLHRYERGAACSPDTPDAVAAALSQAVDTPLPVVVAGHHPLATNGPHGGFHDWRAHIFPFRNHFRWGYYLALPIVGSLYPMVRTLSPSRQEVASVANRTMRLAIERAIAAAKRPPLRIYAAGHEHSLQVLRNPGVDYALVSGSGSSFHQTGLKRAYNTLFAASRPGFMVLDVLKSGVRLSIVDSSGLPDAATRPFMLERRR
jgi:Calcineurin-like phosphoesterase